MLFFVHVIPKGRRKGLAVAFGFPGTVPGNRTFSFNRANIYEVPLMKYKVFVTYPNDLVRHYLTTDQKATFLKTFKLEHFKFFIPFSEITFTVSGSYNSDFMGYLEDGSKITIFFERN